jgi:tRNA modification GTPase
MSLIDIKHLQQLKSAGPDVTVLHTKIDLTAHESGWYSEGDEKALYLSAKNDDGVDLLKQHLKQCVNFQMSGEGGFMARRRHVQALELALKFVDKGRQQLELHKAGELLAEDLRQAQESMASITGAYTSDDLLGQIFSSFCIGK